MNSEIILQIILAVMASNWLGQFLTELYKNKRKKKAPAEIILKSLSRVHLLQAADRYKEQGYINADEYDDIYEEFHAYEDLDGNGRVARYYGEDGELESLPVR